MFISIYGLTYVSEKDEEDTMFISMPQVYSSVRCNYLVTRLGKNIKDKSIYVLAYVSEKDEEDTMFISMPQV